MKKRTFLILTLISIIAMVAGTAMTSNAPRSIRFVGAQFIEGKGAVFHFETTGEFKQSDMKTAFAYGNGGDPLNVHCVVQSEKDRVACTVKDVNRYSSVLINIIGQGFWADVPQRPACLGFSMQHTSGGDATFVSYSWQFGKAVDEQTTIPITAEEFMVILEQHGWNILNKCVTDPSGLAIPVG